MASTQPNSRCKYKRGLEKASSSSMMKKGNENPKKNEEHKKTVSSYSSAAAVLCTHRRLHWLRKRKKRGSYALIGASADERLLIRGFTGQNERERVPN